MRSTRSDKAVGVLAFLAQLDKARDASRPRPGSAAPDERCSAVLTVATAKPAAMPDRPSAITNGRQRAGASTTAPARRRRRAKAAAHQRGFALRGEVEDDAERHRRPQATATAARRATSSTAHSRTRAGTAKPAPGHRAPAAARAPRRPDSARSRPQSWPIRKVHAQARGARAGPEPVRICHRSCRPGRVAPLRGPSAPKPASCYVRVDARWRDQDCAQSGC